MLTERRRCECHDNCIERDENVRREQEEQIPGQQFVLACLSSDQSLMWFSVYVPHLVACDALSCALNAREFVPIIGQNLSEVTRNARRYRAF